jgi:hypothetical protein
MLWSWAAIRAGAFGGLALTGSKKAKAKAAAWSETWRARHDWLKGY